MTRIHGNSGEIHELARYEVRPESPDVCRSFERAGSTQQRLVVASHTFRATLEPVPHGGCYVIVPPEVADAAGLKYKDRVRGTVNGAAYRSSLMKYSGVFHMGVHKATLAKAAVGLGDDVDVVIARDTAPLPNDRVPPDLAKALKARKGAAEAFAALAPSHRREFVGWVKEAKLPQTRARRIAKILNDLGSRFRP